MKYVLFILAVILACIILDDYQERIAEYNAHVCSVYGKMPDCKTPLD